MCVAKPTLVHGQGYNAYNVLSTFKRANFFLIIFKFHSNFCQKKKVSEFCSVITSSSCLYSFTLSMECWSWKVFYVKKQKQKRKESVSCLNIFSHLWARAATRLMFFFLPDLNPKGSKVGLIYKGGPLIRKSKRLFVCNSSWVTNFDF